MTQYGKNKSPETKVKQTSPINSEYKLKQRMLVKAHLDDLYERMKVVSLMKKYTKQYSKMNISG